MELTIYCIGRNLLDFSCQYFVWKEIWNSSC